MRDIKKISVSIDTPMSKIKLYRVYPSFPCQYGDFGSMRGVYFLHLPHTCFSLVHSTPGAKTCQK